MCLYTTQKIPTIADKDIICYKVIRKDMSSYFFPLFKWKFGKEYTSWLRASDDMKVCNSKVIYQGFHSYETLEDLKKAYYMATISCLTVKCTIPSGSKVYKGKHDDLKGYASDQLIIDGAIDTKELYPDFDWEKYPHKEGQIIKYKKSYGDIWKDYQITNVQPHPTNNTRVDLIVKDCGNLNIETTIQTIFNGKVYKSEECFILNKYKED